MVTIDALIERAAALCRAVAAGEFDGRSLYIVPQSRLPDALGGLSVCQGYTTPRLDLHLREYIPGYQGRGPCMVVNDREIREGRSDPDFEYYFLATAIHELAHILIAPRLYDEPAKETPKTIRREARKTAQYLTEEMPEGGPPPFPDHGSIFIRAALHLCHRAERNGVCIEANEVCAGYRYGLSHARRYQQALGDEPERMLDVPIARVVETTRPEAFDQLWKEDFRRYIPLQSLSTGALS